MFYSMINRSTLEAEGECGEVSCAKVRDFCAIRGRKGWGSIEHYKGNHHDGPFAELLNQCVSRLRGPSEVSKWASLMVE